jgi:hypothetical protein
MEMKLTKNMGISGVFENISNEDYHSRKEFISRSALMDYDKSPYTYWAKHINPDRPKKDATPQMIMGSAFHTMILEPHLFDEIYAVMPPRVLLKDVGRETYDAFKKKAEELANSPKIILSDDDFLLLANMKLKFQENAAAMDLIRDARIENSFFWQDKHSGLYVKSRPDVLHENMIVDLKTCADASPRAFQNSMVLGGYHIQGAMIRDGVEEIEGRRINNVINICIETKYPFNMAIYMIDEYAIDEGQMKYKNLLLALKQSLEENNFQDYGIQTIGLPKWAF